VGENPRQTGFLALKRFSRRRQGGVSIDDYQIPPEGGTPNTESPASWERARGCLVQK